jgi:aldose 1-epimerase
VTGATASAPTGDQLHLRFRDQHAIVVEVGAGLRAYEVRGRPLLDGYAEEEISSAARGQILAPWPNRLRDGSYDFDGETLRLPPSEPEKGNATHGLLRWAAWEVTARASDLNR